MPTRSGSLPPRRDVPRHMWVAGEASVSAAPVDADGRRLAIYGSGGRVFESLAPHGLLLDGVARTL